MKFTIATIITFSAAINAFAIPGGYGSEDPAPAPVDQYPAPVEQYPGGEQSSAAPAEPSASAPVSYEPSASIPAGASAEASTYSSEAPSASAPPADAPSVITQTVTITGDCACAPDGAGSPAPTGGPGDGYEGAPPAPPASEPITHTVTVGGPDGDLTYKPETIQAQIGDKVIFQFREMNHTVTESTFDTPCKAKDGAEIKFFPNPEGADGIETEYLVEDLDSHWFYCAQGTHCNAGMVFSLNPSLEKQHKAFKEKAKTPADQAPGYQGVPPAEGTPAEGGYESGAPVPSAPPTDGGYPTGTPAEEPAPAESVPVHGGYEAVPTSVPVENSEGSYEPAPTGSPVENPPVGGGDQGSADLTATTTSCTKTPGAVPTESAQPADDGYESVPGPIEDGEY